MNELMRELLFLPEQASTIAREIDWLHYFVIITTMLGATAVAAFVLIFIIRYREGTPRAEERHVPLHGMPLWLEISLFGGLLLLFIVWWVIGFRQFVRISEPPVNSMTVYVTGKQWMWTFAYPDGTGSNGVLFVPANRPIKLVMTSRDVIHSFFVPQFRVKRDVVPGRATTMWFEAERPGRYPIYCTEYCGMGHSTMRGEVVVLAQADYERQREGLTRLAIAPPVPRAPTIPGEAVPRQPLSLAAMGQRVAIDAGCLRCHTIDGTPHIGPTFAGLYGAEVLLERGGPVVADEAYLTSSMMDPAAQIHRGFQPVMPSYQGLLSGPEIGALVEYIRSLRDLPRRDGDMPLPVEVPGRVPLVQPLPGGEQ
jgi:cytochrome c oxidase subunit 2